MPLLHMYNVSLTAINSAVDRVINDEAPDGILINERTSHEASGVDRAAAEIHVVDDDINDDAVVSDFVNNEQVVVIILVIDVVDVAVITCVEGHT
ncbi:hypothetical protein NDU88_001501 [Pleurodeles waltl]|uniref:Uncharacterized protein n=1 Tax=Pleurodeles waltl TaxID=8319 RepID=A0AAV7LZS8_PLEWA|nr:hypothetical protein NDU88_001501 [Pleurodeles waltl]